MEVEAQADLTELVPEVESYGDLVAVVVEMHSFSSRLVLPHREIRCGVEVSDSGPMLNNSSRNSKLLQ